MELSNSNTSLLKSYKAKSEDVILDKSFNIITKEDVLKHQDKLFYNLAINYSLYNLNPNDIGNWIDYVYHKNDTYQTPIVLNPYRTNGNININSENYLARSRFISLIFDSKVPVFINKKTVKAIEIKFNNKDFADFINKFTSVKEKTENSNNIMRARQVMEEALPKLYKKFGFTKKKSDLKIIKKAEEYLIRKLMIIPQRYGTFNIYINKETFVDLTRLDEYFKDIYEDRSHITLKVRQIINFIGYQDYVDDMVLNSEKTFLIEDLNKNFQAVFKRLELGFSEVIDFIFPPIFDVDFIFDIIEPNHRFSALSSGEKQKLFCNNSLIYHLRNLISVSRNVNPEELLIYKNINIIFDEIELYFHPEFQKSFLNDLMELLKNSFSQVYFENLPNLTFIFITHSPFILSDIPAVDVLYLNDDGEPINTFENPKPSFGANITDLLADAFFVKDGLMGDFAKNKIQETIDFINKNREKQEDKEAEKILHYKQVIETIDEPLLQRKLAEMFDESFEDNLQRDLLLQERRRIDEQLNNLNN